MERTVHSLNGLMHLIFAVIAVTLINIFLFQNYRIPTPSMEKSLACGRSSFCQQAGLWSKDAEYSDCISIYSAYNASYKRQIMVKSCSSGHINVLQEEER